MLAGRTNTHDAYNKAVARDPILARSEFLKGIGVPVAKGS